MQTAIHVLMHLRIQNDSSQGSFPLLSWKIFPDFSRINLDKMSILTFPWLEKVFSKLQVFQTQWEPCKKRPVRFSTVFLEVQNVARQVICRPGAVGVSGRPRFFHCQSHAHQTDPPPPKYAIQRRWIRRQRMQTVAWDLSFGMFANVKRSLWTSPLDHPPPQTFFSLLWKLRFDTCCSHPWGPRWLGGRVLSWSGHNRICARKHETYVDVYIFCHPNVQLPSGIFNLSALNRIMTPTEACTSGSSCQDFHLNQHGHL